MVSQKQIGQIEEKALLNACKTNHEFANTAEKSLLQQTYINASVQNTAIIVGSTHHRSIILKWFANTAERFSWVTSILNRKVAQKSAQISSQAKVLKIETIKEEKVEVFDLMVEGEHEYFANGILVHNCIDATRYVVMSKVLGDYASGMSAGDILGLM